MSKPERSLFLLVGGVRSTGDTLLVCRGTLFGVYCIFSYAQYNNYIQSIIITTCASSSPSFFFVSRSIDKGKDRIGNVQLSCLHVHMYAANKLVMFLQYLSVFPYLHIYIYCLYLIWSLILK